MRPVDAKHGPSVKAIGVDVDPPDKGAMKVGVGDCFADDVTNCLGVEGTQDVKGGLALYVMSDQMRPISSPERSASAGCGRISSAAKNPRRDKGSIL